MKTIILTSSGMTGTSKEILSVLPKPPNELKLANIITASKVKKDVSFVEKQNRQLEDAGFQIEEVDIAGKNNDQLRTILDDKDILYVQGGNTFYLLKHVRESGFGQLVKAYLEQGKIYVGVSAGSYIACPTIEMATWKDPQINRFGVEDLAAMNLVPFFLTVHYEPKWDALLREKIPQSKYPVRILKDTQAIIIKDDKTSFVGEGQEIVI